MNRFQKNSRNSQMKLKNRQVVPPIQMLESRRFCSFTPAIDFIPDASSPTVTGYTPSQISTAYGFSGLTFNSGKTTANGAGQTIAIVDAYNDPNITADLKTFDAKFGLATASLKVVNQTGGSSLPASNGGWAEEISLDVEWVHSIAPGANILLVETNSSSISDLLAGVNYARAASGVSVVSMSWGGSEFSSETSYDSDFTTPSGHTGITFVAASGDEGSAGGVDWPASSPDVLSVGGTSLYTSSTSGNYSSESGWSDSTGGVSQFEGEPEYQSNVQSLDARTVPDVSADANPETGVAVYDSYSYDDVSGWVEFGGTSAAAPQWAGLIAIADQGRVISSLGTLNGTTNTLPTLYSLVNNSSSYSADFHDITSGATSNSIHAGTGYDLVTGIGSARANKLIPALVSSKITTTLTQTSAQRFAPPPFFSYGGYFVATNPEVFAGDVSAVTSTTFKSTVNNVSPQDIGQAMFDSNVPRSTSYYLDGGQSLSSENLALRTAPVSTGSSEVSSPASIQTPLQLAMDAGGPALPSGLSAAQTLEEHLLGVTLYAREIVSQMGRDFAIDFGHMEWSDHDEVLGGLARSDGGLRTLLGAAVATVAAAAILQSGNGQGRSKNGSAFSNRLIELM